jgi:hypothetical protein
MLCDRWKVAEASVVGITMTWTVLVDIAYWLLYLGRELIQDCRLPWQKPLALLTPGRVLQGFPLLFSQIGTPTRPVKTHGKSPGWQAAFVDTLGDPRALSNEYEWRNIAYHLIEAGRAEMLRGLLLGLRFLQAQLNATDPAALAADCALIEADAPVMRILRSFWQVSAHVLSDPANHDQLHNNQLIGRLGLHTDAQPDIVALLHNVREDAEHHLEQPLILQQPSLNPAGGMLEHSLQGHTEPVNGAQELSDGRLLSWSVDNTLRLWSSEGAPLGDIENSEAELLIAATRQARGECVPPVRYATSGDTPHGFRRGQKAPPLRFVSHTSDVVVTGGDGGALHFLHPNRALRQLIAQGAGESSV